MAAQMMGAKNGFSITRHPVRSSPSSAPRRMRLDIKALADNSGTAISRLPIWQVLPHCRGMSLGISPYAHGPVDWHSHLERDFLSYLCARGTWRRVELRWLFRWFSAVAARVELHFLPAAKLLEGLPAVTASVASAMGYPTEALEVLAGAAHLRVSVQDAKLATADQATRENAAIQIVAAIEKGIESRSEFSSIQEISVAIIHPAEGGESAEDPHVEDVMQFR